MDEEMKHRYIWLAQDFWGGDMDSDIRLQRWFISKTRKPHDCPGNCAGELHPIPVGSLVVRETAVVDGKMRTAYTCLPCLDRWAREIEPEESK
jgi:hypothetical protein